MLSVFLFSGHGEFETGLFHVHLRTLHEMLRDAIELTTTPVLVLKDSNFYNVVFCFMVHSATYLPIFFSHF